MHNWLYKLLIKIQNNTNMKVNYLSDITFMNKLRSSKDIEASILLIKQIDPLKYHISPSHNSSRDL